MPPSNPVSLAPVVQELVNTAQIMPLGPGEPQLAQRDALRRLTPETLMAGAPLRRPDLAEVCLAMLWLRYNFLDEAHKIVQDVENSAGSYGHAMMHRREGDFSNSKYWLRLAGAQAIFPQLAGIASETDSPELLPLTNRLVIGGKWYAEAFVDLCSAAVENRAPCQSRAAVAWLEHLQQREWELFFSDCLPGAIGHPQ